MQRIQRDIRVDTKKDFELKVDNDGNIIICLSDCALVFEPSEADDLAELIITHTQRTELLQNHMNTEFLKEVQKSSEDQNIQNYLRYNN